MNNTLNTYILEAHSIHKSFKNADKVINVLSGADFSIKPGESISIQGESGSGKTTFLNILSGIEHAEFGYVKWHGIDIKNRDTKWLSQCRNSFIGLVFQSYYLIPELSVIENILFPIRLQSKITQVDRDYANELLEKINLSDKKNALPTELSGGQRQRVAIARALINNPPLILADEPTGNLDEYTGKLVIDLLINICKEKSVSLVLITHNKEHSMLTDRRLLLQHGMLETI